MRKQRGGKSAHSTAIIQQCQPQTRCDKNPACCSKRNALCFAKPFKPPIIGPQKDFCNQAVGRGIPLQNCELGKPVNFIYARSIFYGLEPADKPGSARQLKNWKKWCSVWDKNQAATRDKEIPPSLMTGAEGWRRKLEDIELVDRTIHSHHMEGFNIRNVAYPDQIGKQCQDIQEKIPRRFFRDYAPMEKIRIPKAIRKEMHLPLRHPVQGKDGTASNYWKWDKKWSDSKYLQDTKEILREDIAKHGPLQPCPDKLIVQGKSMPGASKGKRKLKPEDPGFGLAYPIPQLVFSQETDGPLYQSTTIEEDPQFKLPLYEDKRGPVLYIEGRTFQVLLKQINNAKPGSPLRENQLLYDVMDGFAATTRCKEVRHICLKNQGTTIIRYQWLRSAPNLAIRQLLGNPGKILHLNETKQANDLLQNQMCEVSRYANGGSNLSKNKVSVHLNVSRKIDPALIRTIKIMRNCATSELAFENLLLLLAFRVPRLRRLLVRRTGRQLKRRQLPHHVQQLYLKLKRKQRVERKLKEEADRKLRDASLLAQLASVSLTKTSDESFGLPPKIEPEEIELPSNKSAEVETKCPCQLETSSSGGSVGLSDYAADVSTASKMSAKPKRVRKERVCKCSDPKPKRSCANPLKRDYFQLQPEYEISGEDYINPGTPPTTAVTCMEDDEETNEFSDDDFSGEWEEMPGEGGGIPVGATPDFYPLGYGKNIVRRQKKRRGTRSKAGPKMEYISEPKGNINTWVETQRLSVDAAILHPTKSEEEYNQNNPVFDELQGYNVLRDYDAKDLRVTVEVRQPKPEVVPDGESAGEVGDQRGNHNGVPLRHTPKTHQLNTQPLNSTEIDGESLHSEPKHQSEELGDESDFLELLDSQESVKSELLEHNVGHNSNPLPHGTETHKKSVAHAPKEKVLEFLKDPCFDFHFRELPGVLLPGQTAKFPIIFRPRQPGFYYETVYLVTHPRLCEATYAVRLSGICMDPELPTKGVSNAQARISKNKLKGQKEPKAEWKTKLERVESEVRDEMLKKQGRDLLEAITDNVFYLNESNVTSLPFGKVTTESLFYAHNPTLFYHHGIAEKALKSIRNLVLHVVPKQRLIDHRICSLNIESLYGELSRPDADYLWENFKSQETENLLNGFAECTRTLIKPCAANPIALTDQKFNASYYYLITMLDEASAGVTNAEVSCETPELVDSVQARISDRLLHRQSREEKRKLRHGMRKAALAIANTVGVEVTGQLPGSENEEKVLRSQSRSNKIDVGTQKDANEPEPELESQPEHDSLSLEVPQHDSERKPSRSKDKEGSKSARSGKKNKHRSKSARDKEGKRKNTISPQTLRTPSPLADNDADLDPNQNADRDSIDQSPSLLIDLGPRKSRGSQTEERPTTSEFDRQVNQVLKKHQDLRKAQARLIVFENVLTVGIERMMCVMDNMNNMNRYRHSEYIAHKSETAFHC